MAPIPQKKEEKKKKIMVLFGPRYTDWKKAREMGRERERDGKKQRKTGKRKSTKEAAEENFN